MSSLDPYLAEHQVPTICEHCGEQQIKACDGAGNLEIERIFRACPRKARELADVGAITAWLAGVAAK